MNIYKILFCFSLSMLFTTAISPILQAQSLPQIFDAPWRGFDTGTINEVFGPSSFAVGDLDGDGDIDAVAGNRQSNRRGLSVLKNRGGGTYASPVIY